MRLLAASCCLLLIALASGQKTFGRRQSASRVPAASDVPFEPETAPSRGSSRLPAAPSRDSSRLPSAPSRGSSRLPAAPSRDSSRLPAAPSRGSSRLPAAPSRDSSRLPAAPSRGSSRPSAAGDGTGRRGTPSRVVPARTTPAPQPPTFDTECPLRDGVFADAFQCDRYYECRDYQITEKLCPDGLVFNDVSPTRGRCDQIFSVNCTGREERQEPQPTKDCPRRNGYYADPDPAKCGSFVHCVDGVSNRVDCPAGLVFSLKMGTCQWPDQAGRTGCSSEEVLEFQCPGAADGRLANQSPELAINPRYADPNDCQFFFSCLDGIVPRRHGCEEGRVFNENTKQCDKPENVPECNY